MAEEPQSGAISASYPAPPPFWKSFTTENLDRLQQYPTSSQSPSQGSKTPDIVLLNLPPELRNLIPPKPPQDGKYRFFGQLQDTSPQYPSPSSIPTQERLLALTDRLFLTFLSLTHILATDPSPTYFGPKWDELKALFEEAHGVINEHRPHQARETLILMMEEQRRLVREETEHVKVSVEKARGVLEGLKMQRGMGIGGAVLEDPKLGDGEGRRKRKWEREKRVWEVIEKEVGRL